MMSNFFNDLVSNGTFEDTEELRNECFENFDKDGDGSLNIKEFGALAQALLCDEEGKPYPLPTRMQADMFYVLDKDKDGKIDSEEFEFVWDKWIKVILKPVSALLIVDVQNDFISGTLAICNCPAGHKGEEVVPAINHLLETVQFDHVVYSLDWHPDNHVSFFENLEMRNLHESCDINVSDVKVMDTVIFEGDPPVEQKLWPRHCVQKSWGAELHPDLTVAENSFLIHKGGHPDIDSYSAFWDNMKVSETSLNAELKERNVTDVFVCGIAYDVCVGSTALHAVEHGYRTTLIHDCSRGVSNEDIQNLQKKLTSLNGVIVTSDQVQNMAQGKDRRAELGYKAAMALSTEEENAEED